MIFFLDHVIIDVDVHIIFVVNIVVPVAGVDVVVGVDVLCITNVLILFSCICFSPPLIVLVPHLVL